MLFSKSFLALCVVDFAARMSYNMARTPLLPLFAASLGAGKEEIGIVVGASTVTGIFLKAPAGALSDVFGRARTLLFGSIIFAFMPFLYVFVANAWTLTGIRLVHGAATAIYSPVALAVVASLAGTRKGEMISWFSLIKIATNSIGAILGGVILYTLGGNDPSLDNFHTAYIICGGFGLCALLLAIVLLPMIGDAPPQGKKIGEALAKMVKGLKETFRNRSILSASGMEGMQNLTMGALNAFLPIFAVQEAGLTVLHAGVLWTALTAVSVAAKPIMGRISDKSGREPLILIGMLLCALPFAAIPFFHNIWILLPLCMVFGMGEAFVTSSVSALVAERCKEESLGAAMGVFGTIEDSGQALGPILAGFLLVRFDYAVTFPAISFVILLWTLFFIAAGKRKGITSRGT